jgi:hypothetical protein
MPVDISLISGLTYARRKAKMRLFIYLAFLIAVLHIGFALILNVPMYPLSDIMLSLIRMGIFVPPFYLTLMIATFIIALSVLTVAKRNPILRYINLIVYAVLVIASFQVCMDLLRFGIVWQWSLDSPRIPQAPFALLMVALQTLCLLLLVLPSSSKFFKKES